MPICLSVYITKSYGTYSFSLAIGAVQDMPAVPLEKLGDLINDILSTTIHTLRRIPMYLLLIEATVAASQ